MMVESKDNLPGGTKTGVVAPVPINTPSLRHEIHGSQGDTSGISSLGRSSGSGWGSVSSSPSVGGGDRVSQAGHRNKGRGVGVGEAGSEGGDDVFTRNFPDLRAGLEQAEKLDAVTKASSKVAPLRKPKTEPVKDQGPSLRPRAMLKPTGSAGGGSVATAAVQTVGNESAHNRVSSTSRTDERRRPGQSFTEDSGANSKSRWAGRTPSQERSGRGGRRGGGAWDTGRDRDRDRGRERGGDGGGRGYDRERGSRDELQDGDRRGGRWNAEMGRNGINNRNRESMFNSGAHSMPTNSDNDASGGPPRTLTTTYIRQHGPPPRKAPSSTMSARAKSQSPSQQEKVAVTPTQPLGGSSNSPPARWGHPFEADPWGAPDDDPKWRSPSSPTAQATDASPPLELRSSQSGSYTRAHGPPPRRLRAQDDEQGSGADSLRQAPDAAGRDLESAEDATRLGSSWGTLDHERASGRDFLQGERSSSERWREPSVPLAPAPPSNTRWKEPSEDPPLSRTGMRWKGSKDEGQIGGGRWSNDVTEGGDTTNHVHSSQANTPSQCSWKGQSGVGWGLQVGEDRDDVAMAISTSDPLDKRDTDREIQPDTESPAAAATTEDSITPVNTVMDDSSSSALKEEHSDDTRPFHDSFAAQPTSGPQQPVLANTSWEPQLPRGGDTWAAAGQGREPPDEGQGRGQAGPSGPDASQSWGDPWRSPSFGLSTGSDQGRTSIASFLGDGSSGPRKDRYLPPALRNRTNSEGNQGETASVPTTDGESDSTPGALPADMAANDVTTPALVIQGASGVRVGSGTGGGGGGGGGGTTKTRLYDQDQGHLEWQKGNTQASLAPQEQANASVQPSQHLQLHGQPSQGITSFQAQERHECQMQGPAMHQFHSDHFRTQAFHSRDQAGQNDMSEHLQHQPHQFQPRGHMNRQQFGHLHQQQQQQQQQSQQIHLQQSGLPHSIQAHPHQQGLAAGSLPMANQMVQAHGSRQEVRSQHHHHHHQPQHEHDLGRRMNQQQIQHSSPTFMIPPPPRVNYADPAGGGGLSELAGADMQGSYSELSQHQSSMPPPRAYGFQSAETHHKR